MIKLLGKKKENNYGVKKIKGETTSIIFLTTSPFINHVVNEVEVP